SCGAGIAMVTSLATDEPVERICAAEVRHGDMKTDLCIQVRAVPFTCEGERFLLLFMQDISRQQQWASEERLFFHDLKNVLCGLQGAADLLTMGSPDMARHCGRLVRKLVYRLNCEVEMQRTLSLSEEHTYTPRLEDVSVPGVLLDIQEEFSSPPIARDKTFSVISVNKPLYLRTDSCVLFRGLVNMIINAFEATEPGGEVRLGAEMMGEDTLRFTVWNRQIIPDNEKLRIFQRNFSTRPEEGRGLGTWSMKFFGEKFLGGQVGFTSSDPDGTLFFLTLPLRATG
ncbi:MAG: HAMP domain-containing histidine kinase, partial [Desulfobulbaceae bacterium]|nr:HAMP domain-containing histidine kinase [Desulfobulbaceae bacterium]